MSREIFRSEAVQRHFAEREAEVLPRLTRPHLFPILWLVLSLFLLGAAGLWMVRIPLYVAGIAGVVAEREALVVFLPSTHHARLRPRQPVWLTLPSGEQVQLTVGSVEPDLWDPATARAVGRLPLVAPTVTHPSAALWVPLPATALPLRPEQYEGGAYPVQVEVGHQRLVAFLPRIGPPLRETLP